MEKEKGEEKEGKEEKRIDTIRDEKREIESKIQWKQSVQPKEPLSLFFSLVYIFIEKTYSNVFSKISFTLNCYTENLLVVLQHNKSDTLS